MATQSQFPAEQSHDGEFQRQDDEFRDWIRADGSTPYAPAAGRYHLYISLACPWASRTLIVRQLRQLENMIGVTVVDPIRDERGWAFRDGPGHSRDPINGFHFLSEAYVATNPKFRGRWTVPVLWDKQTRRIVNNSEDDICRMLNDEFAPGARDAPDLFPREFAAEQEALSDEIYRRVNNGVYRAGFATKQPAYERAVRDLFAMLDTLEERLGTRRYLLGALFVESDWRLFCTLVRFDAVYHGHFKCNLRRIVDYPNLQGYLQDLYQTPRIAETVNFDHIKRHYYVTHTSINPTQIVPLGPILELEKPHGRERLRWDVSPRRPRNSFQRSP
jgi:putative glutathione S-transferase